MQSYEKQVQWSHHCRHQYSNQFWSKIRIN